MAKFFAKKFGIFLGVCVATHYCFGQVENLEDKLSAPEAVPDSIAQEIETQGTEDVVDINKVHAPILRDPFWPVGYEPKKKAPKKKASSQSGGRGEGEAVHGALDLGGLSPEERAVIKERMKIGGILQKRSVILVIINNQLVKQGEKVTLESDFQSYDFRVKKLTPDRIVLESLQDE